MDSIQINSYSYDSYASLEYADEYLAAAQQAGTDWTDASALAQAQAVITATRVLDRQNWADGYTTQAERFAVQAIQDACVEMALALIQGSDLQSESSTAQKLASIRAGSVALTYFRGAEGAPRRFPLIVQELLRDYLDGGAGLVVGSAATGVSGTSATQDDLGYTGGI